MTVVIPPTSRASEEFTTEQKREIIMTYAQIPYGGKKKYLAKIGITYKVLNRWNKQFIAGDIDTGLTPRKNVRMNTSDIHEIRRLKDLTKSLEQRVAELEGALEEKDKQLSMKDEQNAAHARAVDSLGKAIAIMQKYTDK